MINNTFVLLLLHYVAWVPAIFTVVSNLSSFDDL